MAIGRLDENSEGLLLLTTDGKLSEYVRSHKVEKEYYVMVDGIINDKAILKLKHGVAININGDSHLTKPCLVHKLILKPDLSEQSSKIRDDRHGPTSWLSITLNEGKFRQIRKMTAQVGFPTLRLVRVRIGNLRIENMKPGAVIIKNKEDINDI
jgi:23S rRNA pseudouridine2457 synthase